MNTFMQEDFLLNTNTAKKLYHETAAHLPIIDYHNHLPPEEIAADKSFQNLGEIWLNGDHYKWRALRANGIEEAYVTGNAGDYEKFMAWADTVPKTLGNPLYHWTHLELRRYFGITDLLNEDTAEKIWSSTKEKLQSPEYSVQSLLKKDKVEFIGTTDDPADPLLSHKKLQGHSDFQVSPSFRADPAIFIEQPDYLNWIERMEQTTAMSIQSYDQLLDALENRIDWFDEMGCRSADHGISHVFFEKTTKEEAAAVFQKRKQGKTLSQKEREQYQTHIMLFLGEKYADKDWAMQLHLHPQRNNNKKMLEIAGKDTGFDSIGDGAVSEKLAMLLDQLEYRQKLPKTILYSVNANNHDILASMAGNFQSGSLPGKIQVGTAWWFNDHINGMEKQMNSLANIGLIYHFIGMLTDSRSFLSFSRHEYFRRILCNMIGSWVEEGKAPNDEALLKKYVENICYYNAKRYFSIGS